MARWGLGLMSEVFGELWGPVRAFTLRRPAPRCRLPEPSVLLIFLDETRFMIILKTDLRAGNPSARRTAEIWDD